MPTSMTEHKVVSLFDLRRTVQMAQGSPREIPQHVLNFIQENGPLRGETLVKIAENKVEVLVQ